MTDNNHNYFENLKEILNNIHNPEELEDHPWAHGLFVQEALQRNPNLVRVKTGQRLVSAIAGLFSQMKPPNPPRRSLRLDPRWGEFGLLASLYFMPYENGIPFPTSYIDAWKGIDPAILYFVYGKRYEHLSETQRSEYRLVGAERDSGSPSTLSDWHKKGVQRLTEIILNRERYLSRVSAKPSNILQPENKTGLVRSEAVESTQGVSKTKSFVLPRNYLIALILSLALLLGFGSFKIWKVYHQGKMIYQEVTSLRNIKSEPVGSDTLHKASSVLESLQTDLPQFKRDVGPFLWLTPGLAWVPVYGGDLAAAPELINLSEHLVNTSIISLEAAQPFLAEYESQGSNSGTAGLTALLIAAQPQLVEARAELDQALVARNGIQVEKLSPRLQTLFEDDLDPLLTLADDSLSLASALPSILGATQEGPKTYLLLVQNEDELRPTGGFITAVGNIVLFNGQVINLEFENVGDQEDWTKPYPAAPWQLQDFMNSPVLILRDSNWFPDFPTTVLWAEYLYAYTHAHSVDGVIAFDQQFLVMLLGQLGPLEVEDATYPLTSENVIPYMREAKTLPAGVPRPVDWYRKKFIEQIAKAILEKLTDGKDLDWEALAKLVNQALTERHLLVQFDDTQLTALLAERGWDNALRPGNGDFLMVVDSNVGFNKTNAVVEARLSYDIDLNDLSKPQGTLLVTHSNRADPNVPCIHWNTGEISGEEFYPIDRCYWDYMRVYKPQGVQLLDASPHAIPGTWMALGKGVPARVDELEEEIPGVQGYGTLLVVPGGQSINTGFRFNLPASILSHKSNKNEFTYHLKVHKQPGTIANPLTVRVHLPNQAMLKSVSRQAIVQDNNLLINSDLRTDFDLDIVFSLP